MRTRPRQADNVEHVDGELCAPHTDCDDDDCRAHAESEAALDADAEAYFDRCHD